MTQEDLTPEQKDEVVRWAVAFSSSRPHDGLLTQTLIDEIGPIPIPGPAAHKHALEYFESKLPAAKTRYQVALSMSGRSDVPQDLLTGVDYWNSVIAWFNEVHTAPDPQTSSQYADGARVELALDINIGGVPYPAGSAGFIILDELDTKTRSRLRTDDRYPVISDRGGLIVVPRHLLRASDKPGPTKL